MKLPEILRRISHRLNRVNAKAVVVGGSVRDHFLQLPIKDYDIEVYGLESLEALETVLSEFGSVNLVGKSFGVLKFVYENEEYDFSFPRLESKVGRGHRGFEVKVDGHMEFKTAAKRRDFTVNAMGYDIEEKCFLDPFNGQRDINEKVLRHIDDASFVEDPLRVYRAVQFSARFGFTLAAETKVLCRQMVAEGMLEELPKERVYTEWKKLLLKAERPSEGFALMRELDILKYYKELEALINVPQDPKWHPEGDVWVHTLMSVDAMAALVRSEETGVRSEKQKLQLLFAVLCHDFGKATTTTFEFEDGRSVAWQRSEQELLNTQRSTLGVFRVRAIGHEKAGIEPTRTFMYRLTDEHDFIEHLLPLVEHHLKPSQFYAQSAKAPAIRRLALKVNIEELVMVAKADFLGRKGKEAKLGVYKAGEWLLEKAAHMQVKDKPLEALLQGRDLVALGLEPSPNFKIILGKVYELQMDDEICSKDDALEYVRRHYL